MRTAIWHWLVAELPQGEILPWWAKTARAVLYPLDTFFWCMSKSRGYQFDSDTWLIDGMRYSSSALRTLAKAQGETYRVMRTSETVTLEWVRDPERSAKPPIRYGQCPVFNNKASS